MSMIGINKKFPWTEREEWAWDSDDVKLLQVIDDVKDVDQLLPLVPKRGTVVQAGGAMGIWAARLAQDFEHVITVEPLIENYRCLRANTGAYSNVMAHQGVLGNGQEPGLIVGMRQHPNEKQNAGSQQVELNRDPDPDKDHAYAVFTIDQLCLDFAVDLICLDLEGYELFALEGAAATIRREHPAIMVEDKGLSTKFGVRQGAVVDWLIRSYGYGVVARTRRDVILAPTENTA